MSRVVWLFAAVLLGVVTAHTVCAATELQAVSFESNGDLIHGWYWLRDFNLSHKAWWTFEAIPEGTDDLLLEITCLATDRAGGGRGFPATFRIAYGFPGVGMMGGVFEMQEVTLPNVSPPEDSLGYTCQGTVIIPRTTPGVAMGTLTVFVERIDPQGPHVAFHQGSIVLCLGEPESLVLQGTCSRYASIGAHEARGRSTSCRQRTCLQGWPGSTVWSTDPVFRGRTTRCLGPG